MCVMRLKANYKDYILKYGSTLQIRQKNQLRSCLMFKNIMTERTIAQRAAQTMANFFVASSARKALMKKLRAFPDYVDYWKVKGNKVQNMIKLKRAFLTDIFEREKRTMLRHYQSKKKFKKTFMKLQNIKSHNLEKILDDYFTGVCYNFYKRQMQIWILLRHKYLRTS